MITIKRTFNPSGLLQVDDLRGEVFTGESGAHIFEISGVGVQLAGTVKGTFLAANDVMTPLTGSAADGVISLTLTEDCYAAPGRFILSIYLSNGNVTECIYCGVGNVFRTQSDVISYPSASIPDIEQIIANAQAAAAQIQAEVTAAQAAVAAAQTAVDGIEAQKDTMIASIASVAGQGTDTTLTQSGVAADAKAAGDQISDLKSAIDATTEAVHSPNVLNPSEITRGYQIYAVSDGKMYANSIGFVSGFIPVTAGDVITRYRRLTETTFYGPGSCNFDGIAEYSAADQNTYLRGSNSVNPYTVQSTGYIRFWSHVAQLDDDYISAVYINNNNITNAEAIEPYYVNLYPVSNPQVLNNTSDIATLETDYDTLNKLSPNDVAQYYSPFYKFPMLSSTRSDFYFQNILYGNYDKFIGAYTGNVLFTEHKDSFSIIPSESSGLTGFNPVFMNNTKYDNPLIGYVALQVVKTTDGQNKTPKVLLIGDSMTEQGKYQNYANQYLSDNGTSVTWLGSRASEYGLHHEGRSGWRAYTYTHFASTTAGDDEGTATTNAFWNPSTNSFDFAYYMQQQGYSSVDIVFINLGTNDFARANHIAVDDVKTAWQTMVDSIHSYNSNIKIVLWLCPMPCLMNGANRSARYTYKMHRVIIDNFMGNAWGYQNVWIMPSYLVLDPVYGFPYTQAPRNQYDDTLIDEPTDTTHPSDSGYHQLSNPVSAMIKYLVKD